MKSFKRMALIALVGIGALCISPVAHAHSGHVAKAKPGSRLMPMLMRVVMKNNEELKLNKEQKKAFLLYIKTNRSGAQKLFKQIKAERVAILKASLNGAENKVVMEKVAQLSKSHTKMAQIKLQCRNFVKAKLNKKQWSQLFALVSNSWEKHLQPTTKKSKPGSRLMPMLMRVVMKNREEFKVNEEQKKAFLLYIKTNRPGSQKLFKKIKVQKIAILKASLSGAENKVVMEKVVQLSKFYTKMAQIKLQCRNFVKAKLSKEQWNQLFVLVSKSWEKHLYGVKQAKSNSMLLPVLMQVIMGHAKELKLNKEQKKAFLQYTKTNKPVLLGLFKKNKATRKAIRKAALDSVAKKDVMKIVNGLLKDMTQIAELKLQCRDFVKAKLSKEQWNQLISIVRKH